MKIEIFGEFIKLSQLLKKMNLIDSGGMAKHFIENHSIKINDNPPIGRGTKVKVGSTIWIDDQLFIITVKKI